MKRLLIIVLLLPFILLLIRPAVAQGPEAPPFPPLAGDVRLPSLARGGIGLLSANGPDPYNTSRYLTDKVAVSVIIAESDGSIDPDTQTWTAAEIAQVHQEVTDGVTWWAAREAQAALSFVFDFYDAQPTGYEPTAHPSDFDAWRVEILNDLGYSETDSVTGTFHLNRDARQAHNAKWAFTVWVVKGDTFTDGRWAYSYLNGPYIQMTSHNAGYTLANMDMVTAHEMGHIFGARDQYAGIETCGTPSGYYEQPTWNIASSACDQGQSDIMRDPWNAYPGGLLTQWTAAQVGWPDANGNGVIDAIDDDATWSNPLSVTVEIGQSANALSLAQNTGGSTWSEAGLYRLAHTGGRSFGMPDRSYLPTSGKSRYAPGESYIWNFSLTAPDVAGVYTGTWQMVNEETHLFGEPLTVTVTAIKMYYVPPSGDRQLIRVITFEYDTDPGKKSNRLTGIVISDGQGHSLPPITFSYVERDVGHYWQERTCAALDPPRFCSSIHHNPHWSRPFLDRVDNGYGGQVDFDYRTEPWSLRALFQVVSDRRITDQVTGATASYHYDFGGANFRPSNDHSKENHYGRFYGFSRATVTDPLGNVTKHYYDNTYRGIKNGYELSVWQYGPNGTDLYRASVPTWAEATYPGWPARVRFVYVAEQHEYLCDGQATDGTNDPQNLSGCTHRQTVLDYDVQYGNLIHRHEFDAAQTLYRTTETEYFNRDSGGHWLLGLPRRETLWQGDVGGTRIAETRFYYDDYGSLSNPNPPTQGNLTLQRVVSGTQYVDTTYAYDAYGNPTAQTVYDSYGTSGAVATGDPRTTLTVYDEHGLLPVRVTNPLSHTRTTDYDYRFQVPLTETDPNGAVTRYQYDPFGRLSQVWLPACDGDPTFQAEYHDTESPYREVARQRVDDCSSPTGEYAETHVFYDGLGRQIQTQTQGDTPGSFVVTNVKYDPLGRRQQVSVPYAGSGTLGLYQSPDWSQGYTLTDYDPLDRVTRVTPPDGQATDTFYNGYQTAVIDPRGHMKITVTDAFGRLTRVEEFADTYATVVWNATPYATTNYAYDPRDHLTQVTDAAGNVTTIAYDALGRKVAMDDPDMGHWTYGYDAVGNLVSQTDARGVVTAFTYDALNRLTGKSYSDGTPAVSYSYDQGPNGVGRRTGMTDAAGTVSWSYDARGRVLTETRRFTGAYDVLDNNYDPAGEYPIGYAYNAADWVIGVTYPDGEVVTTAYTPRGLPVTLTGETAYVTDATYDPLAQITGRTAGNGLTTIYDYYSAAENNNRLRQIQVGNLLDLTYGYDPVGNITSLTDNSAGVGGQVSSFGYDHLDRLTTATAGGGSIPGYYESYAYDEIGNLTARNGQSYAYDDPAHVHAVTAVGDDSYQYDAAGNMTVRAEEGITYTQIWNAENKLKRVTWMEEGRAYTTTFVYDGDGKRLLKIEQVPASPPDTGVVELTTVYLGKIYEEQFDTTAQNLSQARRVTEGVGLARLGAGAEPPATGPLLAMGLPQAITITTTGRRPPGLAWPLAQTTYTDFVSQAGVEQRKTQWESYDANGHFRDIPDSEAGGSGWNTDLAFSSSAWITNDETCSVTLWPDDGWREIPQGSTILGPCQPIAHPPVIWTNLFRQVFHLTPPASGYVLDWAHLEAWSDNQSRWYVNGVQVGDAEGRGVDVLDITPVVQPGANLLAVQSGNNPAHSRTDPGNLMGTAWRVRVAWTYVGTEGPTLDPEPAYTPDTDNTLTWSPITAVSEVTYQVQRATDAAFTQNLVTATTTLTTYTFTGLSHNQTYYYRVRGVDAWGWTSDWSNVVSSTQDAVAPTAWMGALAPYQASPSFSLSWEGSDDGSGLDPGGPFRVQYRVDGGAWTLWQDWVAQTSAPFNGQDGSTYAFRVRARDAVGNLSPWSVPVSTTVDTEAPLITDFEVTPSAFSPNGDGVREVISVTATISDTNPVTWEIGVWREADGRLVAGTEGQGATVAWTWDGSGNQGDGDHRVVLTATDSTDLWTTVEALVLLDTTPPTVTLHAPSASAAGAAVTDFGFIPLRGTGRSTPRGRVWVV